MNFKFPKLGLGKKVSKKKGKPGLSFGLEGDKGGFALIIIALLVGVGAFWYLGQISDDATILESSLQKARAERDELSTFLDGEKKQEITDKFPIYSSVSQDVRDKKDVETATLIRDIARGQQASISGYETELRELAYEEAQNSAGGDIVIMKRKASFVIGGVYANCLSVLKEIENMDRQIEFEEISFAGARINSSSDGEEVSDFFVKYDKLSSMKVEIAYYYLNSALEGTAESVDGTDSVQ